MFSLLNDFETLLVTLSERALPIIFGLGLFILTLVCSKSLANIAIKPVHGLTQSPLVLVVIRRTIRFIILMFGLYLFLRLAGLTEFAVAIISTTGLAGLIVGFAFKDIAENFISSLLISVQKPFRIGDLLTIDTHMGVVNQVTSRATTLVDFDGNHIQIPNAIVYKSVVKNFTANPKMRTKVTFGIGYDASVSQAQTIIKEQLKQHQTILIEPAPQVLVANLGSSTVNIDVYFWVNSKKTSVLKIKSLMQKHVLEALLQAEISMPDDARERILINQDSQNEASTPNDKVAHAQSWQSGSNKTASQADLEDEDVESEIEDIKGQAKQSRSPESGKNIL
jgi:small-conductance mechanosensitive channel